MRFKTFTIFFLLSSFLLTCKNKVKDLTTVKGKVKEDFVGHNSKYKWSFERDFNKKLKFEKQITVEDGKLLLIQYDDNRLVTLDFVNSKLGFYDDNLNFKSNFQRKGDAPFENKAIMYSKLDNDNLYIYEFNHRTVKQYKFINQKDTMVYNYRLPNASDLYRACHLTKNFYLVAAPDEKSKDFNFTIFDSTYSKVVLKEPISKIVNAKKDYPQMVYDGRFLTDKFSKHVAYFCSFTGLFFSFDKEKNVFEYVSKTVDQTPAPTAAYTEISSGYSSLDIHPNVQFFFSGSLSYDQLYLLNKINSEDEYAVDIYNMNNKGVYVGSFYIPALTDGQKPVCIAVNKNDLFVLYENQTIVKYAIAAN
jgi:hypothetical protein